MLSRRRRVSMPNLIPSRNGQLTSPARLGLVLLADKPTAATYPKPGCGSEPC